MGNDDTSTGFFITSSGIDFTSTGINGRIKKSSNIFKRIFDFIFVPYNHRESIVQFIFRNFLIPDSSGVPSWTYSLSAIIMSIFGIASKVEFEIAKSIVKQYDPNTGRLILETTKGISSMYYSAIIVLLGSVVFFIKWKVSNGKAAPSQYSDSTSSMYGSSMYGSPMPQTPYYSSPYSTPTPTQIQIDPVTGQPISQPVMQAPMQTGGIAGTIGKILGGK